MILDFSTSERLQNMAIEKPQYTFIVVASDITHLWKNVAVTARKVIFNDTMFQI